MRFNSSLRIKRSRSLAKNYSNCICSNRRDSIEINKVIKFFKKSRKNVVKREGEWNLLSASTSRSIRKSIRKG